MKKLYLLLVLSSFYASSFAQGTSGYSGTGANINVVYNRINWTIDPTGTANFISGTVTTYFKTLTASVASIVFDLNSNSFPTGNVTVKYHGVAVTRSCSANKLTITLPAAIPTVNTLDSVSITYSGITPGINGLAQGYQSIGTGANKYTSSLSESYEDRDWWPCKADMQDKIDSMDIFVNVPWLPASTNKDTFWVASNGVLVDSAISGTSRTFHYKTRYPIASYLVCLSVGKFNRYYRGVNINGTIVPVQYYLLKNTGNQSTKVALMDKINLALVAFSNKFGDYPFKLEKHGFYDGLEGAGGMEHQTFSGIASNQYDAKTLAHELMHQWFGDNVSFATWNDLWLAEGFARYSEALVGELVPSLGINKKSTLAGFKSTALGLSTASTYIPNASITNSNAIWNSDYGSTVYERGCMVVSMLRALCGDAIFFNTLKDYQTTLAGKSATTDTLNNYFNRALGVNIKPFFDDFVKGTGNPVYTILWQPYGAGNKQLAISVGSTTKNPTSSPVSYFHTPLVLHVTGALPANDTTIVIYDMGSGNLAKAGNGIGATVGGNFLSYSLSFTPTAVAFDDGSETLATGTTAKVTTLDLRVVNFSVKQNNNYNSASLSMDANSTNTDVVLERSADGISFSIVGNMSKLQGTSNSLKYAFNDFSPLSGVNYYRAKYKNAAGQFTYTQTVKIAGSYKTKFSILNNPVKNELQVRNAGEALNQDCDITIYDASGKLVLHTKKNISGYTTTIQTKGLAEGVYMINFRLADQDVETLKFIIQ